MLRATHAQDQMCENNKTPAIKLASTKTRWKINRISNTQRPKTFYQQSPPQATYVDVASALHEPRSSEEARPPAYQRYVYLLAEDIDALRQER